MKIKSIEFYKSFAQCNQIKTENLPEVAFLGRSNVGKSSLINNICNKKVAFTSQTPGKTRLINYFTVNKQFYLVDLPGYGYAQVSKSEKQTWPKMIEDYLASSPNLKMVFFLLDIRRTPNEMDKAVCQWIKQVPEIKPVYVLTKYDKLNKSEANKQKIKNALELFVDQREFIFYSALKNIGRVDILKNLDFIFETPTLYDTVEDEENIEEQGE